MSPIDLSVTNHKIEALEEEYSTHVFLQVGAGTPPGPAVNLLWFLMIIFRIKLQPALQHFQDKY